MRQNHYEYSQTQTAPTAEPFVIESTVPVRDSRLEADVFVPALQTLITTVVVGIGLALLAIVFNWSGNVPAFGAAATLIGMWVWRILRSDRLMWRREKITGRDINGDGSVGRPDAPTLLNPQQSRRTVEQNALEDNRTDVPRMLAFAAACQAYGTSEAAQGIRPNTRERDNYVECRDALLQLGLARWKNENNHAAGWELVLGPEETAVLIRKHVR
jgi:hypothetical protein